MAKEENIILPVLAGVALLALFSSSGKISPGIIPPPAVEQALDRHTLEIISRLHPAIRKSAVDLIRAAREKGIFLVATSGLRTWKEQEDLYAIGIACPCCEEIGRTKPGNIVTNAKPGQSLHNYGLAFDIAPMENGKVNWNSSRWNEIGALGKALGFKWGGDFTSFKDRPHFEKSFGYTFAQLQHKYISGDRDGDYVRLAA